MGYHLSTHRKVTYGTKFLSSTNDNCWTLAKPPFDNSSFIETSGLGEYPDEYVGPSEIGRQNFAFCYEEARPGWGSMLADFMYKYVNGSEFHQTAVCNTANCTDTGKTKGLYSLAPESEASWWSSPEAERIHTTGLDTFMSSLEASLTKVALDSDEHKVTGKAGVMVTFVRVRWLWLILPIILEVLGLLFLIVTVWASRKRKLPLWKASLWPLLFQGLDQEVNLHASTIGHMHEIADNMNVSLKPDDDGRLILGNIHHTDHFRKRNKTTLVNLSDLQYIVHHVL